MDEALQIWGYNSIPGYYILIDEGRWLTGEALNSSVLLVDVPAIMNAVEP